MTRQEHAARIRRLALDPAARRKRLTTMRGVDVPPEREDEWKLLKKHRLSSSDAARAMGLEYRGADK